MVIINLNTLSPLPPSPPSVLFHASSSPLPSSPLSSSAFALTCPPSLSAGPVRAEVQDSDGTAIAAFAFEYYIPPPSLSPSHVRLPGGWLDLTVFGAPPPELSGACAVLIDGTPAHIISTLASTPSSSSIRLAAPPRPVPGLANLSLPCSPLLPLPLLPYTPLPHIRSLLLPSEHGCVLWRACALTLTIHAPPDAISDPADLNLVCDGVSLDPFPGGADSDPRLQILQSTPSVLALSLSLPPPSSPGNLSCSLSPLSAPLGLSPSALSLSFSLPIFRPPLLITSVDPASIAAGPSIPIRIDLQGSGVGWPQTDMAVTIGGASVRVSHVLFADKAGAAVVVESPSTLSDGAAEVRVTLEGRHVTSEVTVTPAGLKAECVSGCRVGFSGGTSTTPTEILLTGFPSSLGTSALSADVDGVSGVVQAVDGSKVSVLLPALPIATDSDAVVAKWLRIAVAASPATFALAAVHYAPPPRLARAQFSSDGGEVHVQTSEPTTAAGAGPCGEWVEAGVGAGSLGDSPQCSWEGGRNLRVVLGRGAGLMPGDELRFIKEGVTAIGGGSDAVTSHAVLVTAPEVVAVPELVMSGPSAIGLCDSASFFSFRRLVTCARVPMGLRLFGAHQRPSGRGSHGRGPCAGDPFRRR